MRSPPVTSSRCGIQRTASSPRPLRWRAHDGVISTSSTTPSLWRRLVGWCCRAATSTSPLLISPATSTETSRERGLVTRNVAALANSVHVSRPAGRTMTVEQARIFLHHVREDRLEAMYVVALSLGLRVSELLAVGWDDLVLDPGSGASPTLTIRRGLKRIKGRGLVIDGVKTRSSRRTVHLPNVAVEQLKAHRARQRTEQLSFPGDWPRRPLGVDLVFRTSTGTALARPTCGTTSPPRPGGPAPSIETRSAPR